MWAVVGLQRHVRRMADVVAEGGINEKAAHLPAYRQACDKACLRREGNVVTELKLMYCADENEV